MDSIQFVVASTCGRGMFGYGGDPDDDRYYDLCCCITTNQKSNRYLTLVGNFLCAMVYFSITPAGG